MLLTEDSSEEERGKSKRGRGRMRSYYNREAGCHDNGLPGAGLVQGYGRRGELIQPGQLWHLDHRDDRRGYLGPSHATCNLRAAAEKTNGKRKDQPLIWSRVWYEPIPANVILSGDLDRKLKPR